MKFGIIEIGSRATRLLIVDTKNDGTFKVEHERAEPIDLAAAVAKGREAVSRAMLKVSQQCSNYVQQARAKNAKPICFGTEALRQIEQNKLFDFRHLDFGIALLPGGREAEYAFWGAVKDPRLRAKSGDSYTVIDLGNASLEIANGTIDGNLPVITNTRSLALGAAEIVRLFRSARDDLNSFAAVITEYIIQLRLPVPTKHSRAILLGSIATKAAWMKVRRHEDEIYDKGILNREIEHGLFFTPNELERDAKALFERAQGNYKDAMKYVDPRSVDPTDLTLAIAGNITFVTLLRALRIETCLVSTEGPRFGVAHMIAFGVLRI